MPFTIGADLTAFLAEPLQLVLGTGRAGNPHMLPMWYEFRDGLFWVKALYPKSAGPTGVWKQNLVSNPNASLFLRDDKAALRWVRIEAGLRDTLQGPDEHMTRLTQRYASSPKPDPGVDPETYRFDPRAVTGGTDTACYWSDR
jgi:hypothetical protein